MSLQDKFDNLEDKFNELQDLANTASWDVDSVRRGNERMEHRSDTSARRSTPRTPQRGEEHDARRRGRRRSSLPGFLLWLLFVVVTSAILAEVGWLLANDFCAFNKREATAIIEVTKEDTVSSVTQKLKDEGLINYKWFFKLYAGVSHAKEKIGEGRYELNSDMDYHALINSMRSASGGNLSADVVKVTIPEGYTVEQIIALLAENKVSSAEDLSEAAKNYKYDFSFLDGKETGSISRLEGYLFPDTYEFYIGEKASSALKRLLSNFDKRMNEELMTLVNESSYSLDQIITIASLIEKETAGSDAKQIASVIYNRIENPNAGTVGLLQIDAALIYGIGKSPLSAEDKEVDTPYNLYKYKGLPPTPIANPGLSSIKAALNPDTTNYFYYALGTDGTHHFFKTYNEHVNFINSSQYGG